MPEMHVLALVLIVYVDGLFTYVKFVVAPVPPVNVIVFDEVPLLIIVL
jgi:hypothetical protein